MAAGNTYTQIASTTLGSAASSVTFSSIAATYTDLVLVINGGGSANINISMQFNGDTTSNYSITAVSGDGGTASSTRRTSQTGMRLDDNSFTGTTLAASNLIVSIMNYANTTTFKTVLSRSNNAGAGGGTSALVGLWRKTPEAINQVVINAIGGNWITGSTFNLYGIQSA
jgi:hypothetical protein